MPEMVSEARYHLDETTLYSVLGLKYGATEVQIRKAYMKLARELHPDKSKSDEAAELFKKVAHAHFVLTDRNEKIKYDGNILSKGLHSYAPRTQDEKYRNAANPERSPNKHTSEKFMNSQARRNKPYEEQPYGFGFETSKTSSGKHNKTNPPIFKTFNAKSYQHSKKPTTPPPKDNSRDSVHKRHSSSDLRKTNGRKTTASNSERSVSEDFEIKSKNKMPKIKEQFFRDTSDVPSSPFQDSAQRQYTRTKFVSKKSERRSTSPIKNTPTSSTETLNNVRNIFNGISGGLKTSLFGHDGKSKKDSTGNPRKLMSDEEIEELLRKDVEEESCGPDRQNISSSINTDTLNASKENEDQFEDIWLDDLEETLPKNKETFDMRNVSESLDGYKVKRIKIFSSSSSENKRSTSSHGEENLQEPVNLPLPRIYKPSKIPTEAFNIDMSISNIELPALPKFHCNVLDKVQVLEFQDQIKKFNKDANEIKGKLLHILSKRFASDTAEQDRVLRVENANNFVEAKRYDIEVVIKLNELQNRQRIVAENHANLINTVFASGTFNKPA